MNKSYDDKLISKYLARLDASLATLPSSQRVRILEEITSHISFVRSQVQEGDKCEVRNLLERLGTPEAIAAEAGVQDSSQGNRRMDALVPFLLLFGGFIFMIGWAVGVAKLWTSRSWTWWEKILGTLVLPGGLVPFWLLLPRVGGVNCLGHCGPNHSPISPAVEILELLISFVAPFLMVAYLDIKRRRKLQIFPMG